MSRSEQMELLKELLRQCLSAAAEEIIRIVQRTMVDHEGETCPRRTEDGRHRPTEDGRHRPTEDGHHLSTEDRRHRPTDADVMTSSVEGTNADDDVICEFKLRPLSGRVRLGSDPEMEVVPQEDSAGPPNALGQLSCHSSFSSKNATAQHAKTRPVGGATTTYRCFRDRSKLVVRARMHEESQQSQDEGQRSSERRSSSGGKLEVEETKKEGEDKDDKGDKSGMKMLPLPVPPFASHLEPPQSQSLFHTQNLHTRPIKTEPSDPGPATAWHQCNPDSFVAQDAGVDPRELHLPGDVGGTPKPYRCPFCTKGFSLTKTLLRHMKVHAEVTVHQCPLCTRRFSQKSELVTHMRVHTGEKPFRCGFCNKAFAQKGNLVVHMRTHNTQKPHQLPLTTTDTNYH